MSVKQRLASFLETIENDLDRTVKFWLDNSHDDKCGGYFICLGPDGKVYDDTKYSWLECRQIWMYARLYNEMEKYKTPEVLKAAIKGAEFMQKHIKVDGESMRCCLSMTRDGQPIKVQKSIFSECFYLMAMSELFRATGEQTYRTEALKMMDKIVFWVLKDDSELGSRLPGNKPCNRLAYPMMLLLVIEQMETMDPTLADSYKDIASWCMEQINKHIQRDGTVILENVSLSGEELPGSNGRLMVPGHAIEAGWFLLQRALKSGDTTLQDTAISKFIINPFTRGWDHEHGGLFYFLDVDDWSPTQLEWDMKLWWPHNEALIAFLMAYKATGDEEHLDNFAKVFDYSYKHFVDGERGDWYGYLDRQGEVKMEFKGGPWKGFFHVPRCLFLCRQLLQDIMEKCS